MTYKAASRQIAVGDHASRRPRHGADDRHTGPSRFACVDDGDVALRNLTYRLLVDLGHAPTANEVAAALATRVEDVCAGWERLHREHALVLQDDLREIRMAAPFSAIPTAYKVFVNDRWWHANCAWDAFGICAALHSDGTIATSCADCGEQITIEVHGAEPDDTTLLFHCLVPAINWWDDIVFT